MKTFGYWAKLFAATQLIFGVLAASPAFSLEDCPNVVLGTLGTSQNPHVYSDCKYTSSSGTQFWVFMRYDIVSNVINVNGNTGQTGFNPAPGSLNLGERTSPFHIVDMGVGYTGDCTEIDGAENAMPAAVTGNTYCGRSPLLAGGNVVLKAAFNGTTFTDYSIKYGEPDPPAPSIPVPTLSAWLLLIFSGLMALFGVSRVRASK